MEASEVFKDIQPFTGEMMPQPQAEAPAVLAEGAAQREIAEVQAAMIIAKRFPRNQKQAIERIMIACQRPSLAEKAIYAYAKGGTDISGPSIHLLKACAQQWGNIDFGMRELEQRLGESTVQAFAWDLETNTRETRTFQVGHIRYKKSGSSKLNDPREIYEMVANLGARRLRACLEGIIPKDVVEMAREQCETTLKAKADISPIAIQKMIEVFSEMGVNKAQIEARIQRRIDAITSVQVISLRKIYNSLKDGMSKPEDWFEEIIMPDKPPRKPRQQSKPPHETKATPPAQGEGVKQENPATGTTKPPKGITEEQRNYIAAAPDELLQMAYDVLKIEPIFFTELDYDTADKIIHWLQKQ